MTLIEIGRRNAARSVNAILTQTCWRIGAVIVLRGLRESAGMHRRLP